MSFLYRNNTLLCLSLLYLAGCGTSGPKVYPLTGKVLFNGSPLSPKDGETAYVEFMADQAAGNESKHLPRGEIGRDGTYSVKTTVLNGIEGGAWIARVVYQRPGGDGSEKTRYAPPVSLIADKFSDFGRSGFKVTVGEGKGQAPDFDVTK
jgi:hypothetical protein